MSFSPASDAASIVSNADIAAAAERIKGHAVETPLLESPLLNDRLGFRLLVKAEPLQVTGSFKFRGAFNLISQIAETDRPKGVVAYSSGNHAQGVAAAARMAGMRATIIMPADAPALKLENTKTWGAKVVTYDRFGESREAIGADIAKTIGATLIKPYDDPRIIAGQGTVGLELMAQAQTRNAVPDMVLSCCGGGGLVSGVVTAVKGANPETAVYAVEPMAFDDTVRSLKTGVREHVAPDARSICDALLTPTPGELTFAINRQLLSGAVTVSDDEALRAMATAFKYLKLVVEPGGAVALAAALFGKLDLGGKTVSVIASGGNVDQRMFTRALETEPV